MAKVDRNARCACGSGKKYKNCCLARRAGNSGGIGKPADLAALVASTTTADHKRVLDSYIQTAMPLFLRGAPLEHLRFRRGVVFEDLADQRWQRLCDEAWLIDSRFEVERVLGRYTLQPEVRDGLHVISLQLERFGAESILIKYIATLEWNERLTRAERLADAISNDGVTELEAPPSDLDAWLADWIPTTRPSLLTPADYVALWLVPDDQLPFLWFPTITWRVSDYCLDQLENRKGNERVPWAWLTHRMMLGPKPEVASLLMHHTPLRSTPHRRQAGRAICRTNQPTKFYSMRLRRRGASATRGLSDSMTSWPPASFFAAVVAAGEPGVASLPRWWPSEHRRHAHRLPVGSNPLVCRAERL
jgi:hypothetical protein